MSSAIFWTPLESHETLLVLRPGLLYLATAQPGELGTAHDMLHSGSDPERVLPKSRLRIRQGQLQQVRHQRNSEYLKLLYVDDKQKSCTAECTVGSCQRAAEAARAIAAALDLSRTPHEETASIAEITVGPAAVAIGLLVMLGGMYLLAAGIIRDAPDAVRGPEVLPRVGRAAAIGDLTKWLGPNGVLALIGVVLLTTFVYWFYRFVDRPAVDVYGIGVR